MTNDPRVRLLALALLSGCCGAGSTTTPPDPVVTELPAPDHVAPSAPEPAPSAPLDDAEDEDDSIPDGEPPTAGIARLIVDSDPRGGDIFLDGGDEAIGVTPLVFSLVPGAHAVQVVVDEADALLEHAFVGGRIHRLLVVTPNQDDPIEENAIAADVHGIVAGHRDRIRECEIADDADVELGFANDASGVVAFTQAFGPIADAPLRCAAIEMLDWRLPATGHEGYYVFSIADHPRRVARAEAQHHDDPQHDDEAPHHD